MAFSRFAVYDLIARSRAHLIRFETIRCNFTPTYDDYQQGPWISQPEHRIISIAESHQSKTNPSRSSKPDLAHSPKMDLSQISQMIIAPISTQIIASASNSFDLDQSWIFHKRAL